ncbi:hypothetical protein HELRODRAFT_189219 [Helobdella robusta]|uniref:RING-type E3 ubiquitin transferase n=1 Tax=Helobdella robusta TaxID=6412 RepID=T1FQT3_HELRO|nr:hypothetical protein HELRODRAFT_189219 [Helobdella robusta]ESN96376.1 hypothetical protein HELRODRAFT_189219 [Helobdella robusta]
MNTKDIDCKNSVRMPGDERETSSSTDAIECSICLSDIEPQARSVISICFHEFCFSCIGKWSKENAVCPLCKQNFTEILHNIRSDADYDACYITRHVLKAKRRLNRRGDGAATSSAAFSTTAATTSGPQTLTISSRKHRTRLATLVGALQDSRKISSTQLSVIFITTTSPLQPTTPAVAIV